MTHRLPGSHALALMATNDENNPLVPSLKRRRGQEGTCERILLNVGGTRFETLRRTLQRYPTSPLATIGCSTNEEAFIDRNPRPFEVVLDFLRTGKMPSTHRNDLLVQEELKHWGLTDYLSDTLPNNILMLIFRYLPLSFRVEVLAQVCRQWRAVVFQEKPDVRVRCAIIGSLGEAPEASDNQAGQSSSIELSIEKPLPRRHTMEIEVTGPDSQLPLFSNHHLMTRMLHNYLNRYAAHMPENLSVYFTLNAPSCHVTSLSIRNCSLSEDSLAPIAQLSHLRFLTLSNCPGATPKLMNSLNQLENMMGLDLDECPYLTGDKDVVPSFDYLLRAKDLKSFSWRDGREDSSIVGPLLRTIGTLHNLRKLYLDVSLSLSSDDESIGALRGLTSLEDLELDTEEFDSALEFLTVVRDMKQLRRLQCDFFCDRDPDIEEMLLDTLSELTNLVRVGTMHNVTKHFWAKFPTLPHLKVLAAYIYSPTKHELQTLTNKCTRLPKLESLRIVLEDCHKVEDPVQK
eukprot:Ihof_evm21s15 gene=Ihof_evmTU21s15